MQTSWVVDSGGCGERRGIWRRVCITRMRNRTSIFVVNSHTCILICSHEYLVIVLGHGNKSRAHWKLEIEWWVGICHVRDSSSQTCACQQVAYVNYMARKKAGTKRLRRRKNEREHEGSAAVKPRAAKPSFMSKREWCLLNDSEVSTQLLLPLSAQPFHSSCSIFFFSTHHRENELLQYLNVCMKLDNFEAS